MKNSSSVGIILLFAAYSLNVEGWVNCLVLNLHFNLNQIHKFVMLWI